MRNFLSCKTKRWCTEDLDCFEVMCRYYVTVSAGKNNIMALIMIILWCCVLRFRMYLCMVLL